MMRLMIVIFVIDYNKVHKRAIISMLKITSLTNLSIGTAQIGFNYNKVDNGSNYNNNFDRKLAS